MSKIVPLHDVNETIPGAPHFRWREFFRSATAKAAGIDNTPEAPIIWDNVQYLASNILEPVRNHFGAIRINSGYRCPQLNRLVGGSSASFHAYGMAADIEPLLQKDAGFSVKDLFIYIHSRLPYTELIAEELPDGWVHVALAKGRETERQLKYKLVGQKVKRGSYNEIMRVFA